MQIAELQTSVEIEQEDEDYPQNFRIRQENEVDVLKAIFCDDLKDLREKDSLNLIWQPSKLLITLKPQTSNDDQEVFVWLDLYVECSEHYPLRAPKIQILNPKNLSSDLLSSLSGELENLSKLLEKKNEVMILDLAFHVQKFLHQHNKPPRKSFYDEMIKHQQHDEEQRFKEIQEIQQKEKLLEERKRLTIKEELQKKHQTLRQMSKCENEYMSLEQKSLISVTDAQPTEVQLVQSEEVQKEFKCSHRCYTVEFVNKVSEAIQVGPCMAHSKDGANIRTGVNLHNGKMFVISEWELPLSSSLRETTSSCNTEKIKYYSKQISIVERELQALLKLHHSNLVCYYGIRHLVSEMDFRVLVLQEHVFGISLSWHVDLKVPASLNELQYYARGILKGLTYLHNHDIVHRNLHCSNVFINKEGIVKVADYCIGKRLSEVYHTAREDKNIVHNSALGKSAKKHDIYRFGLVMLSLFESTDYCISAAIPSSFPEDLKSFLNCCLTKDEKNRWQAEQILNHNFLKRSQVARPSRSQFEDISSEREQDVCIPYYSDVTNLKTRLCNEFQILKFLGRGAFGDVVKVQNRLDGCIYAVKKIILNPDNRVFNKKMMREVKLLSRLNHENIVRYYNSWIEFVTVSSLLQADGRGGDECLNDELGERIHDGRSPALGWSSETADKEEESESSEDEDVCTVYYQNENDSSDSIVFRESCERHPANDDHEKAPSHPSRSKEEKSKKIQFMYIQMEFCEKNTLRTAIDGGLHQQRDRLCRLFREIVSGLAHIHQQGMIHRDLKPANIFLDFDDHVKIGDFGLATGSMTCNRFSQEQLLLRLDKLMDVSHSEEDTLTGQVGTALYSAPEVRNELEYTQKIDMYSLGVTLFEMCYPPLSTVMERVKVISHLRLPQIVLPDDFDHEKQSAVIRWLLDHDPLKRPSALELLQSDLVPPQLEEAQLQEVVKHAISNPQSKAYKHLVSSCFSQDIAYDMDVSKESAHLFQLQLSSALQNLIHHVFQWHGAIAFAPPLLMPSVPGASKGAVKLMDHSGNVVALPRDLRTPLARFLARKKNIDILRCYRIGKVFAECQVFGFHPHELLECAFDVVAPNPSNLMPESEVLTVVSEIVSEIPSLHNHHHHLLCINHSSLLQAIFDACALDFQQRSTVSAIFQAKRYENWSWMRCESNLTSLGLPERTLHVLQLFAETEGTVPEIQRLFKSVLPRNDRSASLVKSALQDIETVVQQATWMGFSCSWTIVPILVLDPQKYRGITFEYVMKGKRNKVDHLNILASGGRYDCLIAQFRQKFMGPADPVPSAVGISVFADKILHVLRRKDAVPAIPEICPLEAVVCSVGRGLLLREKAQLAGSLWSSGIRSQLLYSPVQSLEDVQNKCREAGVSHLVVLKESESGFVRLRTWDKDKLHERKVPVGDLTEYLQKAGYAKTDLSELQRSDVTRSLSSDSAIVVYTFLTADKLMSSARRRYEAQIYTMVADVLNNLAHKTHVEVAALELPFVAVKTLAAYLNFDSADHFYEDVPLILERHPRYRKYLENVCSELYKLFFEKKVSVVVLFSLHESKFKVVLQ